MSFFGELRRRNVVKVAVAYAIVGWLMVQIADVFLIALRLPEWTVTFFAALLVLGFPIALFLSWAYELTPAGMKKTQSVPLSQSISKITGRQLDFVIMALMAVGIVFLVVDNYVLDTSGPFAGAEIDPASLDPSLDEPPTPTGEVAVDREVLPNSVAVLPLENLSPDPDNAYFAAGMHEEILNQLVKLRNLNVISRTSVLQYAEDRPSIPEIARELNVQAVMEGSVRFDGERVLVQAQLIDAATDSHLWSAGYEREFAGVFAIQSDIAMNIANALEAEFSLAEQQSIEKIPTVSPEAYAWYLRALAWAGNRMADVSRALEIDPNFAAAYAFRAWLHAGGVTFSGDVDTAEEERLALEDAERALALDPTLGLAHVALANVHEIYWRWEEAREAYERAYELSPTTAEVR